MNFYSTIFAVLLAVLVAAQDPDSLDSNAKFDTSAPVYQSAVTDANDTGINLDVVAHQNWVQDYGKLGCMYANRVRAQHGRHQLYYSASLTNLGARHSNWMANTDIFQHQNLNGLGVWVGNVWLPVTAENIAMSVPRSHDPSWDAHEQWYNSYGHFLNMISPHHTHCGVGIAYDRHGRWWGTQLFGYTNAFGDEGGSGTMAPAPAPAPAAPAPGAPAPAPESAPSGDDGRIVVPEFDPNAPPKPQDNQGTSNNNGPPNSDMPASLTGDPLSLDDVSSLDSALTAPDL